MPVTLSCFKTHIYIVMIYKHTFLKELSCLNFELIELIEFVEYFGIHGRNSHGWVIIDVVQVYISARIMSLSVLVLRI